MKNHYKNPFIDYYNNQIGLGISGYSGLRYQRGYGVQGYSGIRFQRGSGIFGRVFSWIGKFIKDLAPKVAKRTLPSAIGLAQDIAEGQNVGESAKKRLIEAGKSAADETLDQIKSRIQGGSGLIRRKRKYISLKKSYATKPKRKKRVNKRKRRLMNYKF